MRRKFIPTRTSFEPGSRIATSVLASLSTVIVALAANLSWTEPSANTTSVTECQNYRRSPSNGGMIRISHLECAGRADPNQVEYSVWGGGMGGIEGLTRGVAQISGSGKNIYGYELAHVLSLILGPIIIGVDLPPTLCDRLCRD